MEGDIVNRPGRLKSNIKAVWIISIIAMCFNGFELIASCVDFTSVFDISLSVLEVGSAIFAFVVFLIISNKDIEYLKKNYALIVTATVFAFLSSILAGIFGIIVCNDIKNVNLQTLGKGDSPTMNAETSNAENNAQAEKSKQNEMYPAEELLVRLKTLQKMKTDGEISDEEYEQVKQKMIDDFKNSVK